MKRKLSFVISLLMLLTAIISLSPLTSQAVVNPEDYNTSIPTHLYEFDESPYSAIRNLKNCTVSSVDGYLRLVASGDDPYTTLITPSVSLGDLAYAAVRYRVSAKEKTRYAERYYAADNGATISEDTKMKWTWKNQNDEWADQILCFYNFRGKDNTHPTAFRFDFLADDGNIKVKEGDRIDVAYMAFFRTEEEAARFNIDEYHRCIEDKSHEDVTETETESKVILPGDWQVPTHEKVHYSPADDYEGSLEITHNDDGKVTISYLLNGERVSYTVDDTAQNACGPLKGMDDLGRELWDMYTEVDPTYTALTQKGKGGSVFTEKQDPFTIGTEGERITRDIGIFYFACLGAYGDPGVYDITKILGKYGDAAKDPNCPSWGSVNTNHFFAEPLYGYYFSNDTWVMRKHVELLINAGIDFLYFDTTNDQAFTGTIIHLMEILHEFNERGYKAPKIVFYTHHEPEIRVSEIYYSIYKKNLYPDTWYYLDGKPLIIAPRKANINNFFTIREPQWPNESQKANAWPWIDWNWPQKVYRNDDRQREAVSVSVAQHSGNSIFSSVLYGYEYNWGRSFNGTNDLLTADSYKLGLNIQNEFNYAMTTDAPVVLVTGWNEWMAGRQNPTNGMDIVFIDQFNLEYSRDIEMTRGGYFDNYYMQLISNNRALKGAAPTIVQDARHLMNITGSFDQWDKVIVSYPDPVGDTAERNSFGFGHTKLTDTTGRNDIVEVKVTNDTTYLYFYIKTDDTIVRPDADTQSSWMQIFLNVDGQQTGWYGYDFILNNHPKNDLVTTLARYSAADGYGFTDEYEVSYRVLGNEMMIAVPMEYLGITEYDRVNVQFKAADSDTLIDEMEDFYIEGDAAPLGRPNFVYQTYIPNVTEGEGTPIIRLADKLSMSMTDPEATKFAGSIWMFVLPGAVLLLIMLSSVYFVKQKKQM
ncbi:MAG: hypothetical protein MJ175_05480 [Clostridia bacterium]|nr:hypothetical protein [Clostridia bacterium]